MEKFKSVIRKVVEESSNATLAARKDWAHVTGKDSYQKTTYYVNKETGEEYLYIAGGIAWPDKISRGKDSPGFAIIVAVDKTGDVNDPEPPFRVLWEAEEENVKLLLWKCVEARYRFGYLECPEILHSWYGDYKRYQVQTQEISGTIERKWGEEHGGFFINPALDVEGSNSFDTFAHRIQSFLTPNESGKKRLVIGRNERLRNRLQNLTVDSPAILALGYVVHSVSMEEPWKVHLGTAFNLGDDLIF